jgi:hypothetical protein
VAAARQAHDRAGTRDQVTHYKFGLQGGCGRHDCDGAHCAGVHDPGTQPWVSETMPITIGGT